MKYYSCRDCGQELKRSSPSALKKHLESKSHLEAASLKRGQEKQIPERQIPNR